VAGQRAQLGVDQRQHVVRRALVAGAQAQQALGDRVRLWHGRRKDGERRPPWRPGPSAAAGAGLRHRIVASA
jgi:hypothetical protein